MAGESRRNGRHAGGRQPAAAAGGKEGPGMDGAVKQAKGRPRGKTKNGRTISCYIRDDIYEALAKHCEATGQTKTVAIERAIERMTRAERPGDGSGAEDP